MIPLMPNVTHVTVIRTDAMIVPIGIILPSKSEAFVMTIVAKITTNMQITETVNIHPMLSHAFLLVSDKSPNVSTPSDFDRYTHQQKHAVPVKNNQII